MNTGGKMRKVLLLGKLNEVIKDIDQALSTMFHVQICELRSEVVDGMLKVVEPELVVISLVGADTFDATVFRKLQLYYSETPVLTIGTEEEQRNFYDFYRGHQFMNLTRPADNRTILMAALRRLGLEMKEQGDDVIAINDPQNGFLKNVLVVDDDPVTLRTLKEMLSDFFNVTVAISGIQALTAMGRCCPDLILLDYEMPVCDGKQTLEMIRADVEYKDIPVIFLTGISDREHIEAVINLKPAGYILKPASKEKLVGAIKKELFK